MALIADADRFGFDWPANGDGCHVQVTRTTSLRWKGRDYRYVTVRTERDEIDIRVAPGGSIRVTRGGRELKAERVAELEREANK